MLALAWEMTPQASSRTASRELKAGMAGTAKAQMCLAGTEGKAPCSTTTTLGLHHWHPPSPTHDSTM